MAKNSIQLLQVLFRSRLGAEFVFIGPCYWATELVLPATYMTKAYCLASKNNGFLQLGSGAVDSKEYALSQVVKFIV